MKLICFGARGSIPVNGKNFEKYGGNTTCWVLDMENKAIIFDAGTGFIEASKYIENKDIKEIYLLITHAHADHIQGLGFGQIIYKKLINIFIPKFAYKELIRYYSKNTSPFPLSIHKIKNIKINIVKKFFFIKDIKVDILPFQHRGFKNIIIYKLNLKLPIVFSTDIEFDYEDINKPLKEEIKNKRINEYKEFIKNSIVIIDGTFDEKSYMPGFGHAYIEQIPKIVENSKLCLITHHNPFFNDKKIDEMKEKIKSEKIIFAKQGMVIEIE